MNNYETVCIVRPEATEEAVKAIIQKAEASIGAGGGKVNRVEEWGRRKLAYHIRKKSEGYYFICDYSSPAEASRELERTLRLNEDVLRYQTVKVEERKPVETKGPETPPETPKEEPKGGEAANG